MEKLNPNIALELLQRLRSAGDGRAIKTSRGKSISSAQLAEMATGLAWELHECGMKPGDRVLIQVSNGELFICSALATMALGAVPVFADPRTGLHVYRECLRTADPHWNIVHPLVLFANRSGLLSDLVNRKRLVIPPLPQHGIRQIKLNGKRLRRFGRRYRGKSSMPALETPTRGADDAAIAFTGGTTKAPRGVVLSHDSIRGYLRQVEAAIEGASNADCLLAQSPQQVLIAMWLGKSAMVAKGHGAKLARNILRSIHKGDFDAYFGSPYIWQQMMSLEGASGEKLPPSLKLVLLGGAPVTRQFLERLQNWLHSDTHVQSLYGLTEAGPVCTASLDDKLAWQEDGDLAGRPLPSVDVTIDNPNADGIGDVSIVCPSLYTRYLGETPREPNGPLHTGDLGKISTLNGTQRLVLMGRRKDMIIRYAVNIYPANLEPAILGICDSTGRSVARECALIGVWDEAVSDEKLVLCVVPMATSAAILSSRYRTRLGETLGADLMPDAVLDFEAFPTTGRQQKVDRNGLKELVVERLAKDGQYYLAHPPGQERAHAI